MSQIFQAIKDQFLTARKAKDTFSIKILSTFIGGLENKVKGKAGAVITDDMVIAEIKANLKRLEETKNLIKDQIALLEVDLEKNILQAYMPTQLSDKEIQVLIENSGIDNIGKIQAFFKIHYAGKYDGATVSRLAKETFDKLRTGQV